MDGDTVGNPDVTLLVMLLDRSGSMHRIRAEVEEGFDAFIADQRDDGGRCTVSLYQFDSGFEPVYVGVPIGDVPPLSIRPRGNTALYDAIGRTILSTRVWLDAVPALVGAPYAIVVRQAISVGLSASCAFFSTVAIALGSCPSIATAYELPPKKPMPQRRR